MYQGMHVRRWFQGVSGRDVLLSAASVGLAGSLVAGTIIGTRAGPAMGSQPPAAVTFPTVTTSPAIPPLTVPPTSAQQPPVSVPLGAAVPTATAGTPGSTAPPSTVTPSTLPPTTTTVAPTTMTRGCRKVVSHTSPHITVIVCIPVRK